jgi:hypothetical protein
VNIQRRMLFAFSIQAVLIYLALSTLSCFAETPPRPGSVSTALPPNTTLSTILGLRMRWADLRGHLVLMAFLQLLPDTDSNSSRVQLQYLRSMNTQYHSRGLAIVVVDESYLVTHVQSQPNLLLNALYDLNMSELGLVPDPSGQIRAAMQVKTVPTTVLFDPAGNVIHRWSGVVLPAFLAEAIVKANGAPGQDGHPSNNNP